MCVCVCVCVCDMGVGDGVRGLRGGKRYKFPY